MRDAVRSSDEALRCPLCLDALRGAVERCDGCGTGYHAGCRRELGRCATLGCGEAARPTPPRQATRAQAPWAVGPGEGITRPPDEAPPRPERPPGLAMRAWWSFTHASMVPRVLLALLVTGVVALVQAGFLPGMKGWLVLVFVLLAMFAPRGRRARP